MNKPRMLVIACASVIEEMLPLLPRGVGYRVLDFGLHTDPEGLRGALQGAIDDVEGQADVIALGYGLCSQGVMGISSARAMLVVPRVDDCIALFLGSRSAYRAQFRSEPGTYYLTKGWIEVGDSPCSQYERMVADLGQETADELMALMLHHYTRLALIRTGEHDLERYRGYAQRCAARFGLRYDEIDGSTALIMKMLAGQWDEDFVVVRPGEAIEYEHFYGIGAGR